MVELAATTCRGTLLRVCAGEDVVMQFLMRGDICIHMHLASRLQDKVDMIWVVRETYLGEDLPPFASIADRLQHTWADEQGSQLQSAGANSISVLCAFLRGFSDGAFHRVLLSFRSSQRLCSLAQWLICLLLCGWDPRRPLDQTANTEDCQPEHQCGPVWRSLHLHFSTHHGDCDPGESSLLCHFACCLSQKITLRMIYYGSTRLLLHVARCLPVAVGSLLEKELNNRVVCCSTDFSLLLPDNRLITRSENHIA